MVFRGKFLVCVLCIYDFLAKIPATMYKLIRKWCILNLQAKYFDNLLFLLNLCLLFFGVIIIWLFLLLLWFFSKSFERIESFGVNSTSVGRIFQNFASILFPPSAVKTLRKSVKNDVLHCAWRKIIEGSAFWSIRNQNPYGCTAWWIYILLLPSLPPWSAFITKLDRKLWTNQISICVHFFLIFFLIEFYCFLFTNFFF